MVRKLLIIICATAKNRTEITKELKQTIANYKDVKYKLVYIKTPPDLQSSISRINIKNYDVAIIYGGDGTVVSAFKAFIDYKLPLLILPGGTANLLANYFDMPASAVECLELYLKNTYVTKLVDIASVNDSPLVLDMHMGLWTEAIKDTPKKLKGQIGSAAYAWSTIKKASSAPLQTYEFALDDQPIKKVKGYTFLIANQGRHEILGKPIFPREQAPGMVQIAIVKSVKLHRLILWFFYSLFTYGHNLQSVVEIHQAKKVKIIKAPQKMLADDSEITIPAPVTVNGSTQGVRVLMPPKKVDTRTYSKLAHQLRFWSLRFWQRFRVFANLNPSMKYSHIAPNLYVGGKVSKKTFKLFRKWGIKGVVSMRTTKPPKSPEDIETLWLPTRDWTPPTLKDFKKGSAFIQDKIDNNGSVYIHCKLGEGRGPSMAAAYLITKGFTTQEAVDLLTKYRPVARPNRSQLKQLARWQETYNSLG